MLCQRTTRLSVTATIAGLAFLLSACGTDTDAPGTAAPNTGGRVAVSHPGGISVLDGTTLELVKNFDSEEFTRLNPAGDGRHVVVTTTAGFQMLDMKEPKLTDLVLDAKAAGHVVRHDGKTVFFDDGTGTTTVMKSADLAGSTEKLPTAQSYQAPSPHHGVSIVLKDGTLLTTVGDKNARTGAMALEAHEDHWHSIAESKDCPGIHGEGTAADETVVFGCEDGALMYHHGSFEKLTAPDKHGRMGNAYVSESSPIVVGDYNNNPDSEGYLLNTVALLDTEKHSFKTVTLPADVQYTYRDVARGPEDLAYILSTNGSIHVLDPKDGTIVNEFPVIEAWEGPAEWQDAHPTLAVNGNIAYVTEPANSTVHAVDLTTGKVSASVKMDAVPNEIAVNVAAH